VSAIELNRDTLLFYGNLAGYVEQGRVIVDPLFASGELEDFLEQQDLPVEWRAGVFEQLAFGLALTAEEIKNCRIWQLRPGVDPRLRFAEFDKLGTGIPNKGDYRLAYDGSFGTNDLEAIYSICNQQPPDGYSGHPLTISDVVELYDSQESRFYYADRVGFQEIEFDSEPAQDNDK